MRPILENLENRLLFSAPAVAADGAETFARAASLGRMSGQLTINNALSTGESSDFFRFTVRAQGNVNLTLGGLSADANLRLFDADGRLLAGSARPRARTESISRALGRGTYTISVDRGKRAADTAYSLALQADLNYQTVNIGGTDYRIGVVRADGSSAPIVANRETWVVIHGWLSTPKATASVANAIDAASRRNQVLQVDWSPAAADANAVAVVTRVPDVAAFVAGKLADWGIPGTQINLVGHSFGGYMTDQIARRIRGGVDRVVALDPATLSLGGVDFSGTDYAAHSRYSVAFVGSDLATLSAARTADQTIKVDVGKWSDFASHARVRELFAGITRQNNRRGSDPISALFSLRAIGATAPHPFLRDGLGDGYEATMVGAGSGTTWLPRTLTYKDASTRRTVTLRA